ncbi:hypothetical protein D3C85_1339930 [compost metagenome]
MAGGDLHRVFVLFPADRCAVAARVRDHEEQRRAAELEAALQHFNDLAVRQFVNLIDQHEVRPRPRAGLAGVA